MTGLTNNPGANEGGSRFDEQLHDYAALNKQYKVSPFPERQKKLGMHQHDHGANKKGYSSTEAIRYEGS